MKPTVGRIVHFNADVDGTTVQHAAMVTHVHGDACVSLVVFPPDGGTHRASSVTLGTAPGSWQWPVITPPPAQVPAS